MKSHLMFFMLILGCSKPIVPSKDIADHETAIVQPGSNGPSIEIPNFVLERLAERFNDVEPEMDFDQAREVLGISDYIPNSSKLFSFAMSGGGSLHSIELGNETYQLNYFESLRLELAFIRLKTPNSPEWLEARLTKPDLE